MSFWRGMFGLCPKAWKPEDDPWTPEALAKWKIKQERYMRMGLLRSEHVDPQCSDIRHVLAKAIQEVGVLTEMMKVKCGWDEYLYRELLTKRMISDHSSVGAFPWTYHSLYPYTLEEEELLRHRFNASFFEVSRFQAEVERVSSETT